MPSRKAMAGSLALLVVITMGFFAINSTFHVDTSYGEYVPIEAPWDIEDVVELEVQLGPELTDTHSNLKYRANDDYATVTGYTGDGGEVTVPDELGGKPVKIIWHGAFAEIKPEEGEPNEGAITGISLPITVVGVGGNAFFECVELISV